MNETIDIINNHRSIRKFSDKKLTQDQIETIITAAQQASTSSHVMAYTIIGITDMKIKEELTRISGQPYVKDNGHLFVFCADLNRIYQVASKQEQILMDESIESTEQFIVATVDATLVAQNVAIAAESLGLGICFIGSLRNDINRVNTILDLPTHVVPLFGMAVGYPEQNTEKKPRLPFQVIYHENKYHHNLSEEKKQIDDFDQQLKSYYENRTTNARTDTWTEQMFQKFSNPIRMDVTDFVKNKKLNRR